MINILFFRDRDVKNGQNEREIREIMECYAGAIDISKGFIPAMLPISTSTGLPFIHIEGSIDTMDEDLITIADRFNKVLDVSIRFSWGPMIFRRRGQGFGHNAITEAKNKMREIINELIYPDPNTA